MEIAAVLIAIAAFLITIWQVVTRHRPLLGVDGLEVDSSGEFLAAHIRLRNWGQTKADRLVISVEFQITATEFERFAGDPEEPHHRQTSKPMHIVFPGQVVSILFSAPQRVRDGWEHGHDVRVKIELEYWAPR